MIYKETLLTPWGVLILISHRTTLKSVYWEKKIPGKEETQKKAQHQESSASCPVLTEAIQQLTAYMAGRLTCFSLPLEPADTDHRCRARHAMEHIPYGETVTYQELGITIGSGSRSAGQACKHNPFSIIIPCHRVIKTGGDYGNYGGGRQTKKALINFEGANSPC